MMAPNVAVIIPARFGSKRYPGKPLALISGCAGAKKPLIQRSHEAAQRVDGVTSIHIATDSEEIKIAAQAFGADVIMTSPKCANGTERCADALARRPDLTPDIVINLQGDALLTPAYFIENIIEYFQEEPATQVATPAIRCSREHYLNLLAEDRDGRVGGTSVIFDDNGRALYFSKRLIPHFDPNILTYALSPLFLHIGVYGYRPAALNTYMDSAPTLIEELEGLEQLRFLHYGSPVHVVQVAAPAWEIWELNNPSDLEPIEKALKIMKLQ